MAASVTKRYTTSIGPLKIEYIFIDANDGVALADVETNLQNGFACNIVELSHSDGTTNDSMAGVGGTLAVFSAASGVSQKLIDVTVMGLASHYMLVVFGF